MKYKITWTDICIENFYKFGMIGFPVFIFFAFFSSIFIDFLSGDLWLYSIQDYIVWIYSIFFVLFFIYIGAMVLMIELSFRYRKNTVVGEHEIFTDTKYLVWKWEKQEIKTKLDLLRDLTVRRNYITLKFDGVHSITIAKRCIQEGYDEFITSISKALTKKK